MEEISSVLQELEKRVIELDSLQYQRETALSIQSAKGIIDLVDSIPNSDQLNKTIKAKLAYFKGRALVVSENYEKSAEELLSRSIKLDPRNSEAWSWLGEVFYFKKDYPQAKRCFEGSLEYSGPKKETLRKLSIIHRFANPEDRKESVLKGIDIAKQALALDFKDPESWYILGNAHLTNYFTNTHSYEELTKALKSYSQSQNFSTLPNPDLHYNLALALNACQRYQESFNELEAADRADPGLNAKAKSLELMSNIRDISLVIQNKCNMKKKAINMLSKSIPSFLKNSENIRICGAQELTEGKNLQKMLSMKVLWYSKQEFPPVFVGCDSKGYFFALSIFNLPKQSNIVLGCGVFISDPLVINVAFENFSYVNIQVTDPNTLMVHSLN